MKPDAVLKDEPKVILREGVKLREAKCACCEKCWVYVEGIRKGVCLYGGPFIGYVRATK